MGSLAKMELDMAIEATPEGIFVEEGQHCLLVSSLPRSDETQANPAARRKRRRYFLWGILLVWLVVAAIVAGVLVSQRQSNVDGPQGVSGAINPEEQTETVSPTGSPNTNGIPPTDVPSPTIPTDSPDDEGSQSANPVGISISPWPSPILSSTSSPNNTPSDVPNGSPDITPSSSPNDTSNEIPTQIPAPSSTDKPVDGTEAPVQSTGKPTENPTSPPTNKPVETSAPINPTRGPTVKPTAPPTNKPVATSTPVRPKNSPSGKPTPFPTVAPVSTFPPSRTTISPTSSPSVSPSKRPKSTPPPIIPTDIPTPNPSASPSKKPKMTLPPLIPSESPSESPPTPNPTPPRVGGGGGDPADEVIVLAPDEAFSGYDFILSPNALYRLTMTYAGDVIFELALNNQEVWRIPGRGGIGASLLMQPNGNLAFRDEGGTLLWSSDTGNQPSASLRLDNDGQLAVIASDGITPLWIAGVPGGIYDPSMVPSSLTFPVRGAFYYSWFSGRWSVDGNLILLNPTLGQYSTSDRLVQLAHVNSLEYANVDLAIMSWLGPDRKNDRATITNLMDKSIDSGISWTVYYQQELEKSPLVEDIWLDLAYLKKWFAWHETWAHVGGKPVIFVFNGEGCDVSNRWMEAANEEWYVVLRLFKGHKDCQRQPDHWHQNSPEDARMQIEDYSFSVSPGFWLAGDPDPRLPRQTTSEFLSSVQAMVDSEEPWQLITSFNEWGAGTSVESSMEWTSPSGHGRYLEILNSVQTKIP